MIQSDPAMFRDALFVLMFSAIASFLLVTSRMRSPEVPARAIRLFNVYFVFGLVGWVYLWAREAGHLDLGLGVSVVFHVCVSLCLVLAVVTCARPQWPLKGVVATHALIALLSLLVDQDAGRVLVFAAYNAVAYSAVALLCAGLARRKRNLGYALIGLPALLVVLIAPFQAYEVLSGGALGRAFSLAIVSSSAGFVLVGIGFLSAVLISEHRALEGSALRDPLTGLLNRRGLEAWLSPVLSAERRHGRGVSLIVADVDHFKRVNDQHGHQAGDSVLQQVATVFDAVSRPSDAAARLGGEEFVLVLPETRADAAVAVAERLRSRVEALRMTLDGQTLCVTASFGVSTGSGAVSIEAVIHEADQALYAAKSRGRNCVVLAEPGARSPGA